MNSILNNVQKPWGSYRDYVRQPNFVLKLLEVNLRHRLSLQYHRFREEHWICIEGQGTAWVNGVSIPLEK